MVLHFGHLVHRPSGISRFFDFEPASFGFLAKVVLLLLGGGVTAGASGNVAANEPFLNRNSCGGAQTGCQALCLVKFPFTFTRWVERNRNNAVPTLGHESRRSSID